MKTGGEHYMTRGLSSADVESETSPSLGIYFYIAKWSLLKRF